MTFFDFFVLVIIGFSVVTGVRRGLVKTFVSGIALILGLLIAARGYEAVGSILHGLRIIKSSELANACGFLLIMIAALIGGFFAGRVIKGGLRLIGLDRFDRILGGALGLVSGLATCSVIYLALSVSPVSVISVRDAHTAPILAWGARTLGVFTSQAVRSRFNDNQSGVKKDR